MTRGNVKESNSAQIQRNGVGPESVPGHDNARRNTALQRMIDIKKSYDFWQELVNKNMRSKLKQKKLSDADAGENSASHVGEEDDDFFDSEMTVESQEFFSEQDLQFLRKRLDEIVSQNGIQLKDGEVDRLLESCVVEAKINQGFDPYGNEDEEGLHDGNSGEQDEELPAQDDYNVEELQDEESFSYEYPTRHHHFEVELSDRPPGSGPPDDNEASCEFTFEYDRDGKLIPTSNNIEEKLRLMNLQSQITNEALSSASASAMAIASAAGGKKKKKHQKKKKKTKTDDDHGDCKGQNSNLCLFCQYEAFYGVKPVYSMKRQDYTHKWEMRRRMEIREKLQTVKSEHRARHGHSRGDDQPSDEDSEGSHGTLED